MPNKSDKTEKFGVVKFAFELESLCTNKYNNN